MAQAADLISGDALKAAALRFLGEMRTKVEREQSGLHSIFDSWFTRVLTRLIHFDPARSWEDSVRDHAAQSPAQARACNGTCMRLRLFSIAGSKDVSWNFPSASNRALIITRGSAPNSASTCC